MRVPTPKRRTLQVDFDGVIQRNDELVPGCEDALRRLRQRYRLVVLTAREDTLWCELWLEKHGLRGYFDEVTNVKQRGDILDDNATRFTSWEQALQDLAP